MITRSLSAALIFVAALSLTACDGSSGGDAPPTGNVAVVITDGPTDIYDRIEISMTEMLLIGPGGQVELYSGSPVTFDLLEMSEWGDLALNSQVLAGTYNKIRIQIDGITLSGTDNGEPVAETIDNLPANGKIDLHPRGPFEIVQGKTTVIKLDIDAKRSFQAVQTGQGKLQFRPVVFVEVLQEQIYLQDRLVRAFGTVAAGSIDANSFRLCDLQFISQSGGPSLGSPNECIRVHADTSPGIFDELGAEAMFADAVAGGDLVTAIGFIVESTDVEAYLALNSVVLQIGARKTDTLDGWETLAGMVASVPAACDADQCFAFDRADDVPPDPVVSRMQSATKVYAANGAELMQGDVADGDQGSIDGLVDSGSGELLAALVVLAKDGGGGDISGTLDAVSAVMGTAPDAYYILTVTTTAGSSADVCIDANTDIVEVLTDDGIVTILDLLDPSVLTPGSSIEAYDGMETPPDMGCAILADTVVVTPPPAP